MVVSGFPSRIAVVFRMSQLAVLGADSEGFLLFGMVPYDRASVRTVLWSLVLMVQAGSGP